MKPSASSPDIDLRRYLDRGPGWMVPKIARQQAGM
jgi:hypothetical protein